MTKEKLTGWGWYAGPNCEEMVIGPEPSLEAVLDVAKDAEVGFERSEKEPDRLNIFVCKARRAGIDLAAHFDTRFGWFLELLGEDIDEAHGADLEGHGFLQLLPVEDADRLRKAMCAAISDWQSSLEQELTAYAFEEVYGEQCVVFTEVRGEWVENTDENPQT